VTDAGTTVARAVVHDRPTWLAYLQLGLFGYYLYAFGPSIGLLRDDHGYTRTVASLHGTALAVGSVLAGLIGASVVRRIGRGGLLRAGSAILALGIVVYTGTSPLALTVLGAFVASLGGTLIMVGVNAFLPDHQGAAGPRAMSEAHALGAGMGLLGPLAVGIGAAIGWGWRVGLLVTILGLLAVEIARGRNLHQFDGPHGRPDSAAHHAARGPLLRLTWFAVSVFGLAVGTEFCLTLWGSDLLRDRAGLGSAAAAAALVTIVGGMALGRILAAPVVSRVDPDLVLMGAMGLTVVGFGFAWLSSSAVPMLVGFAITGLGLGPQSPLGITRAVVSAGPQADRGAGMTSVAAGVASGAAPVVLAAVADSLGVRVAFLLVPLLLAAACTLVVVARVPPPTAPPAVD
jgi:predicted MFS family arabinose efflux permease